MCCERMDYVQVQIGLEDLEPGGTKRGRSEEHTEPPAVLSAEAPGPLENPKPPQLLCCPHCTTRCGRKEDLMEHMSEHSERPYVCLQCGKSYTQRANLQNHLLIHNGEKPFSCSQCDRSFTRKGDLKKHIIVHFDERPFTCHICGNNFRHQGNLTSHLKIHTSERVQPSSQSDSSIRRLCNFSNPLLFQAGESLPFSCETCGQRFSVSSHLRRHQRWHDRA
ncbi:hypothetical protein DNTS_002543 [Danionella cerebrum]|uniref:C2H2-type domain-containing protein n=1 Tax=Danionella cerebrum TaxID=2873325 RepID=A0A553MSN3_9TELE|nr:hypothetical protein DNTS_002543 [Danionella translucida]